MSSPRVAPGLLTLATWDLLRGADVVRAPDLGDPTAQAVARQGIEVVASDAVRDEPGAAWLAPVGDAAWVAAVVDELGDAVVVVEGAHDLVGSRVLDLVAVMDTLRRECPWTAEQTHASLSHYLLEETYETLEALDAGDSAHLREELGDLLMQIVFHSRIAAESEGWTLDDVAAGIAEKLVYRNPHVFSDLVVADAAEVDANWQRLKASEKRRERPTDGIPAHLPALAYAAKVLGRIDGLEVPVDGSLGARLLALVTEARAHGVDAEEALRQTVRSLVADTDA